MLCFCSVKYCLCYCCPLVCPYFSWFWAKLVEGVGLPSHWLSLVFSTPLLPRFSAVPEHPYQRSTSAMLLIVRIYCVVVGAGRHPALLRRVSEWTDADRLRLMLSSAYVFDSRLYGGWWPTQPNMPPEGHVLRQRAIALGIPAEYVLSTARVSNTEGEAKEVVGMLPLGTTIILVTSAFHMPRAKLLFERHGFKIVPFAVDFQSRGAWAGNLFRDPLNYLPTSRGLQSSSRAIREAIGRVVYRVW